MWQQDDCRRLAPQSIHLSLKAVFVLSRSQADCYHHLRRRAGMRSYGTRKKIEINHGSFVWAGITTPGPVSFAHEDINELIK